MKLIPLTRGESAIVDDEDYNRISQWKWHLLGRPNCKYAARSVYKDNKRVAWMHRVILNAPKNYKVDHINGNTLDNRKQNLRLATVTENQRNRGKTIKNKSGYKGVRYKAKSKRYEATITITGKWLHLGYFATPQAAARAYNTAARKYHGQFARLNDLQK